MSGSHPSLTSVSGSIGYYARELYRRLAHYRYVRRHGYPDHGSLEAAAEEIIVERASGGFSSGGHFRGLWPRDLCFSAPGLLAYGFRSELHGAVDWLLTQYDGTFFTDVQPDYAAAVPSAGVDTFPALVIALDAVDGLLGRADRLATLAAHHRERFFDEGSGLVSRAGSGWWDSAAHPRVAYNTAMLLAALERMAVAGIDSVYTDAYDRIRETWIDRLWTGDAFAEHESSSVLACDANVVPLYFGLVDSSRARSIVTSLQALETDRGIALRKRPFSIREVHPFFWLHRDYHYHVWPWNSFAYAIGLSRYGFDDRANAEVERVERTLERHGTFLEIYTLEGAPYVTRGYAAAGDFMVAAALWAQYRSRNDR
ncbi:hypothetical protein OB919_19240 [Halobacteria archaeon AArc-curdl1]|uniref:Uncharacterized protein n=1 Tax=Natronosalvus hydrolyticus TaxID=2979988 RepID=A0AAP2ZBC4_9EURY|nr:hypothetical protein [Halobacteria archaeon AArc-curdl1]